VRATEEPDRNELKDKFFNEAGIPKKQSAQPASQQGSIVDSVNPIELGRQARRGFNAFWGGLTSLTAPTKSMVIDDVLSTLEEEDFGADALQPTVLVAGATGQVGRIVVRKLLLRGYKVRALVRKRAGIREEGEGVPDAVEIVEGDVGELKDCARAVRGIDKVGPPRTPAAHTAPWIVQWREQPAWREPGAGARAPAACA
jgi:hypothetical protein